MKYFLLVQINFERLNGNISIINEQQCNDLTINDHLCFNYNTFHLAVQMTYIRSRIHPRLLKIKCLFAKECLTRSKREPALAYSLLPPLWYGYRLRF